MKAHKQLTLTAYMAGATCPELLYNNNNNIAVFGDMITSLISNRIIFLRHWLNSPGVEFYHHSLHALTHAGGDRRLSDDTAAVAEIHNDNNEFM